MGHTVLGVESHNSDRRWLGTLTLQTLYSTTKTTFPPCSYVIQNFPYPAYRRPSGSVFDSSSSKRDAWSSLIVSGHDENDVEEPTVCARRRLIHPGPSFCSLIYPRFQELVSSAACKKKTKELKTNKLFGEGEKKTGWKRCRRVDWRRLLLCPLRLISWISSFRKLSERLLPYDFFVLLPHQDDTECCVFSWSW